MYKNQFIIIDEQCHILWWCVKKTLTNVLSYGQELGLVDGHKINLIRPFSFKWNLFPLLSFWQQYCLYREGPCCLMLQSAIQWENLCLIPRVGNTNKKKRVAIITNLCK